MAVSAVLCPSANSTLALRYAQCINLRIASPDPSSKPSILPDSARLSFSYSHEHTAHIDPTAAFISSLTAKRTDTLIRIPPPRESATSLGRFQSSRRSYSSTPTPTHQTTRSQSLPPERSSQDDHARYRKHHHPRCPTRKV